ncbi:MAG: hypothetical protein JNL32_12425, partial [Candidatus Kapabacteria bacterium]|nr:hypothetical protein [Candidatus Kapabacteria bacterium]
QVDLKNLKSLAIERNMFGKAKNRLITAFKADSEAPYGLIVQVLDILNQAEGDIITQLKQENPTAKRERKFAVIRMTDEDKEKLKGL